MKYPFLSSRQTSFVDKWDIHVMSHIHSMERKKKHKLNLSFRFRLRYPRWPVSLVACRMLTICVFTFLSGGSRGLQLLALSWWSSSNLRLMFSIDSWSISQKPARSEATGRGWALGFCSGKSKEHHSHTEGKKV